MTKQTTDPVEVLEANILDLEQSLAHAKGREESARRGMSTEERNFRLATERHQRRAEEVEAIEKGMIDHREAIAKLRSLQTGATIVYNFSPQVMDEEDEFERAAIKDDDHECPIHGSLECPTGQHP